MHGELQIRLRDGRRIGVAQFGAPSGHPVLYCHGFPASRLEARLAHAAALRLGVRLIALDRPGFGLSDFKPGRTIIDWACDVTEVADSLALERFAVLGVSGGGPYALACAAQIPDRLSAVGVVCGLGITSIAEDVAQMNAFARCSLALARRAPRFSRLVYRPWGVVLRERPQWTLKLLAASLPAPDRAMLADADVFGVLAISSREAFRQGGKGAACELTLYARAWDFELSAARAQTYLWHGEQDTTVPVAMGKRLATLLPNCVPQFYPDEGHFSLPVRRMDTILASLLQHA